MMSLLKCENLSIGYEGKVIRKEINFTVDEGNYLCIVGENGSGKSTLMKTLLRLLPPVDGNIHFDESLTLRDIGYLPQQTVVQKDFPASVREIVLSGCQGRCGIRPFYNKEEKERANQAMKNMGIDNLAHRCYRDLSGGQQQRVLLARALCASSRVLLLDEPVAGLDPRVTEEMYQLIDALKKKGMTIIMISHDINIAVTRATHILHMGEKLFFGTKEQYLQTEIGKNYIDGGASNE